MNHNKMINPKIDDKKSTSNVAKKINKADTKKIAIENALKELFRYKF